MALRRICVVVVVWACSLHLQASQAASTGNLKSPLDLSYILNDLKAELGGLDTEAAALGGPPASSLGKPDEYGLAGDDDSDHIVLYANDAGDRDFRYKQHEPISSNLNNAPSVRYSAPGVVVGGGGPGSPQEPTEYVYPLYDDSGSSRKGGAADAEKQLISFGQNVQQGEDHHHYPIEIPALPPTAVPVEYYNDGGAAKYPIQRRRIVPSPYSNNVVDYSVSNNKGKRNDLYNVPIDSRPAIKHKAESLPYVPQVSLSDSNENDDYSNQLPGLSSLSSDASSEVFPESLFPSSGSDAAGGGNVQGQYGNDALRSDPLQTLGAVFHSQGRAAGELNADPEHRPVAAVDGYGVSPQAQQEVQAAGRDTSNQPVDVYKRRTELQCWPQFFFEYKHDFSGPVWQDVKGEVRVEEGRAVFDGHGFLALPFFACNDLLPRYSMIFVISPSKGAGPQAIIGNSVSSARASLLLSLSGNTLTLVVRQRIPGLTPRERFGLCYGSPQQHAGGVQGSNPVSGLGVDNSNIVVLQLTIVPGEVTVSIAQENDWIALSAGDQYVSKAGRLPALTNEALYVGAGADPRGGGELAHYTGTFDSFLFEKCP